MNPVFGDTAYWIALIAPDDALRLIARQQALAIGSRPIITTQMVLTELLDGAAARGAYYRANAVTYVEQMSQMPNVRIVPQTPELFAAALALYKQRPDKEWSLTDCASCVICQQEAISDVLTHDRHFEQMGFNALLRADAD